MRLTRWLAAAFAILATPALAQSTLLQAGPTASGRVPMYVSNGTSQPMVQDSGPAGGGQPGLGIKELGLTVRGQGTPPYADAGSGPNGENFCNYDAPTTNATGYHYLCMSPNADGGGLISYGNVGAAAALPLRLMVNGSAYEFPFAIGGIVGPVSSTVNNLVLWNNTSGTLVKDGGALGALATLGVGPRLLSSGGNLTVATVPANTWTGNATGSTAAPTDNVWASCPDTTGNHLNYVNGSGLLCGTSTPAGVDANTLNAQATNYTILASDAGKTVLMSGGPFTVTLPAVGGFATNATVNVCNGNANNASTHAMRLSGFPTPYFPRLYQQQCLTVAIANGAWVARAVPGRFHPAFTPTLYIDTANGSNTNDGFVSNAAGNPLASVGACFEILQKEYDLAGNIQPLCSPTAGQTFTGSWTIVGPLVGASVINITGNGGIPILRPTASAGYVLQLSDFAPYVITTNVTFDCTGGAAGCVAISFHQQTGADINAGTTLVGNAAGHIGLSCDSMCKINIGAAPLNVSGTFSSVITLDQGSIANVNSGVALAAGATIGGSFVTGANNSAMYFYGALTAGAGISIGEVFTGRSGTTICVASNFTTSGSFGAARQWSILNGAFFSNASAVAVPGSTPGITTSATFAAGVIANSGLNSGGC